MSSRKRIALLVALLGGSLVLLFRPISEPVTREAIWRLEREPAAADRCPRPAGGQSRWTVRIDGDFPWITKAMTRALGPTCVDDCTDAIRVDVTPVWIDEPHFFSGYGRLDIPVVFHRTVGACSDRFELRLDMRIDEGTRGSPKLAQLHTGKLMGGFFRDLYTAEQRWPGR